MKETATEGSLGFPRGLIDIFFWCRDGAKRAF